MNFGGAAHNGKPQTDTAASAVRALEGVEDGLSELFRDAGALIGKFDGGPVGNLKDDFCLTGGVLDGIFNQISDRLFQRETVGPDQRRPLGPFDLDHGAFLDRQRGHIGYDIDADFVKIDSIGEIVRPPLQLCRRQQLLQHARNPFDVFKQRFRRFPVLQFFQMKPHDRRPYPCGQALPHIGPARSRRRRRAIENVTPKPFLAPPIEML